MEENRLIIQCLQSITSDKKNVKAPVYQRKTAILEEL